MRALLGAAAVLLVVTGGLLLPTAAPGEAAPRRRTPTPTPTVDLTGWFRIGQAVQWLPPRVVVAIGRGGTANVPVTLRVSQRLEGVELRRTVRSGRIDVLGELPSTLEPDQAYTITLRLTRPDGRNQAVGYLQVKAGDRFVAPILGATTRTALGR